MSSALARGIACALVLALGTLTQAQTVGTRPPAENQGGEPPQTKAPDPPADQDKPPKPEDPATESSRSTFLDRLYRTLSQEEDPDGPINTDRPTFTPANTVVPVGRIQVESGFTFNLEQSGTNRSYVYDLPELAVR